MTLQKHTLPNQKAAIFGETDNINYFLKTALEADSVGSVVNINSTVKAHTRRQYVGDSTPSNVPSHTRVTLFDPGRKNGSATPGKNMLLSDGTERRAFTYIGPWTEIHAFLVGEAKMDLAAYSESARYDIKAAGEAAALVKAR